MMRLGILAGCAAMIVSTSAPAAEEQTHSNTSGPAEPGGEWLVNDQTAMIRIEKTAGEQCGER